MRSRFGATCCPFVLLSRRLQTRRVTSFPRYHCLIAARRGTRRGDLRVPTAAAAAKEYSYRPPASCLGFSTASISFTFMHGFEFGGHATDPDATWCAASPLTPRQAVTCLQTLCARFVCASLPFQSEMVRALLSSHCRFATRRVAHSDLIFYDI